jgi:hypothetical protein
MGDLAYHDACGQGVVIVPLHDGPDHPSALLVLRATDLGAIGWQELPGMTLGAFCAVDPSGLVYVPGPTFESLARYELDCAHLDSGQVLFVQQGPIHLIDENYAPLERHHKQGATFSPSGDFFVMSTGYGTENSDPVLDGIHFFDTTIPGAYWRRIAHSSNGAGLFSFLWDPADEEPEGMTWIDLDGAGVPGMSGELHILLLNNNDVTDDDIFFKHYSNRIYVDEFAATGSGTYNDPFATVGQANATAWDGCEMRIRTGSYDEGVIFSHRMRILPIGGPVSIGE